MATPSPRKRATSASRRPPTPAALRELRKAGVFAEKSLGQHFLTDQRILEHIAQAALPTAGATVIEIGAGLGDLTVHLSERAVLVIAVEKDNVLAARLSDRFSGTNVHVLHGDALEIDPNRALTLANAEGPYRVTGNLPYNVAQPLLRRYLEALPRPEHIVAMVQAEVAESIVAQPGEMSLLGLSVQLYGDAELLFRVPASAFYPPPKVQSAVVRIDVGPTLRAQVDDVAAFFEVARAGFGTRRKQIRNSLANGLRIDTAEAGAILSRAGVQHTKRAQELSLEEWASMTKAYSALSRAEER